MAETCKAPDGSDAITFGLTKSSSIMLVGILGCLPLVTILLGPRLVFWVGSILGSYLRGKTAGRRAQILEMTEKDEAEWEKHKEGRRDSDEWENVDAYAVGTAGNGEKGASEWDGVVGFLHPFW
jgi:alpha-1,2-mannosyltransferase